MKRLKEFSRRQRKEFQIEWKYMDHKERWGAVCSLIALAAALVLVCSPFVAWLLALSSPHPVALVAIAIGMLALFLSEAGNPDPY